MVPAALARANVRGTKVEIAVKPRGPLPRPQVHRAAVERDDAGFRLHLMSEQPDGHYLYEDHSIPSTGDVSIPLGGRKQHRNFIAVLPEELGQTFNFSGEIDDDDPSEVAVKVNPLNAGDYRVGTMVGAHRDGGRWTPRLTLAIVRPGISDHEAVLALGQMGRAPSRYVRDFLHLLRRKTGARIESMDGRLALETLANRVDLTMPIVEEFENTVLFDTVAIEAGFANPI